jgi:hypothetical protein
MDVESLAKQLILQNMTPEQQNAVLESVRASLLEARSNQKRRVSENVGMVVDALKKIEADIRAKYDDLGQKITDRVNSVRDGVDGIDGRDGKDGKDGRPGRDGATGPMGPAGKDGVNGVDGEDGVSVTDAKIDFDGSLVISLSNGREINVGEVVAPDLAERIKVITNGGGTSQTVIDTLASLQQQINDLIPSQTGNAGKFLTTDGTDLSWSSVAGGLSYQGTWNASTNTPSLASGVGTNGYYYVVSVDGSTNLDGITDWKAGDWLLFNGTVWQKIDQSWAIAGANDNITSMTGITGGISSPDFIQFDTTATVTDATGRLYYNDEDMYQTLAFQMNGNVIQHVGEEMFYRVRLTAAATKGQVLMFTGTLGASGGLTAAPATGLTFEQSNYLLGVAGESGITNDWITVYGFGEVKGVNTSAFTQGQILYYDPTVAGGLTATKPSTPNAIATVAAVVHVGTSNGVLFVRPTFGSALGATDGNVRFGTLASGNTLIYDAVDGVWKNANLTDGTGITITEGAGSITVTNAGVTSLTGTTNEIDVSASTGSVTLSLPATINANTTGNAANVTGTVAIANGGTGQTSQTAAFDALAPTTTKGDLIVSNGADNVRLPVGTNNYVLMADSAEATGVKWAAGGGGMADPGANGVVVRTALNTTTARTITAGTGISVTNGDGVSGNPTIANDGVTSITGTANQITASASTGGVTLSLPSSISTNLNGSVGAGTPNTGAFTTLSATGVTTVQAGTVSAPAITTSGDTNTGIFFPAADTIAFSEGGVEAMRIDSSGRLGFPGAQSAYGAVTVYGTKNGWGGINFNSTAGTNIGTLMMIDGVGGFFNSADNAWLGYFTSGGVVFSNGATFVTPVGTAPAYGARAWVNFNGTGTVAIRASGNVTSITDNGTGDYTVNFTTAMPDANYATKITTNRSSTNTTLVNISRIADELASPSTTAVRIVQGVPNSSRVLQLEDASFVCVSIFR